MLEVRDKGEDVYPVLDVVQIIPEDFRKKSIDAIEDNLNAKYSNKGTGLTICVYDILKLSDGLIGQDASKINVNAEFRLLVFRPFKGEIITGRISSSSELGIKDFFEDIWVFPNMLFENTRFNRQEQCWMWEPEGCEEPLYFDKGDWVRVRVEDEEFHDNSPAAPAERDAAATTERKAPYSIRASMSQSGLGSVSWW